MVHRVAVVALPSLVTFDLTCAVQLLGHGERYEVTTCAPDPVVATDDGFSLAVECGLEAVADADTVVVPGYRSAPDGPPADAVLDALRAAAGRGARIASICVGAFALGHAGLLDGRRATTHWAATDLLAARFPAVRVVSDVLYVDEGEVLTSAGLASGLDLVLHLVRRDHGARVAAELARWNVVAPHRDGAQAQFVSTSVPTAQETTLAATCGWALQHLERVLDVADLAAHAGMSERSLLRRFRAEVGTSPRQWLLRAQLDRARELLEATDLSVDSVARRAGFPSAAALRARSAAVLGTTPSAYRRSFTRAEDSGDAAPENPSRPPAGPG